jgi:UDP-2,4-diacetamido-2,4,6-trideoxy-beta-L-altropyranose hydrolase
MAKRTILFRADGGSYIGMGHFTRTLALAEMLNKHFHCIFATRQPTEYQINEIDKICHGRIDLAEDDSHFEQFLNLLKGNEIVVLDNYYFTTEYQKAIKAKGCKLICIDDMHDKHYVADIVINHVGGIRMSDYSVESDTKLLLGYQYALLRPIFLKIAKEHQKLQNENYGNKSALICFGGSDPHEIIQKVVNAFLKNFNIGVVHLVSQIDQTILNNPFNKTIYTYWNLDGKQMAYLMRTVDVGAIPASTMAIEACACRLPFLTGWFVENQKEIYNSIVNYNLGIGVGNFNTIDENDIQFTISEILLKNKSSDIIDYQCEIIDGKSDIRLLNEIKKIVE